MPRLTATIICAAIMLIAGGARAQECPLPFERVGDDWVPSPIDANTGAVSLLDKPEGPHARALKIEGRTPKSFGVTYYPWQDWTGATALSFEMYFPPECRRMPTCRSHQGPPLLVVPGLSPAPRRRQA